MRKPLLCVLALVLLAGADSPKEYDDTTIRIDNLVGAWKLVGMEQNGVAFGFSPIIETYHAGGFTTKNAKGVVTDEGTYKADRRLKPAHLEETSMTAQKGRTYRYLYQLDGDKLKIGYKGDCSDRPKSFDEQDIIVLTFRREKE